MFDISPSMHVGSVGNGRATMSGADFLCWVNVELRLLPSKRFSDIVAIFLLFSPCHVLCLTESHVLAGHAHHGYILFTRATVKVGRV